MTRAIILAAGLGSRLHPYTSDRPKSLVNLSGKSLLERQLSVLRRAKIEDIILVGGYKSDKLEYFGLPLVINPNFAETNMVHSLMCAKSFLNGVDDVVVSYGDIIYEKQVLERLLWSNSGDISVVTDRKWETLWKARMGQKIKDYESFSVDDSGYISELGRTTNSISEAQGQYIGLIKIPARNQHRLISSYNAIQASPQQYMTEFIQVLIENSWKVSPVWIDGGWLEVDSLEDLESYETLSARGRLDHLCRLFDPPDVSPLLALGGKKHLSSKDLDEIARRIEIHGEEQEDSILASFLLDFVDTEDYRRLNTVLKAPETPSRSQLITWCEAALNS